MVTFKQFLFVNEEESRIIDDVQQAADLILRDCQPFLTETKFKMVGNSFTTVEGGLWRGSRQGGPMVKMDGRRYRNPLDSDPALHSLLDNYFTKKFGFPYRSLGTFCSTRADQAKGYAGGLYLIFPIGEFQYVYSDYIKDVYFDLQSQFGRQDSAASLFYTILDEMGEKVRDYLYDDNIDLDKWFKLVEKWLEKTHPYTDKNLGTFIRKDESYGHEVVLNCKQYYALRVNKGDEQFANDVLSKIGK